ncbi:MAG: hypothetical protein AAF581_21255, partial [Planctomycetota bacterium]
RVTSEITNSLFDNLGMGPPIPLGTEYSRSYRWLAQGIDVVAQITSDPSPVAVPAGGFSNAFGFARLIQYTAAPTSSGFVRGDVNDDGAHNIVDPINILLYLFASGTMPCLAAADLDDNGNLDTADAVYLLSYLFNAGPAPAAPYPSCGPDPTLDLTCAVGTCP